MDIQAVVAAEGPSRAVRRTVTDIQAVVAAEGPSRAVRRTVTDIQAVVAAEGPSSGGSPREGARSEERAEQRLAAGGRRLPDPDV